VDALRMVLDELPSIAPVPAAEWAAWAAGSGVMMCMASQSYAQLEQRYGAEGAATLWQTCRTRVVWGGTSEHKLGEIVQQACGTARVRESEWGDRQVQDGDKGLAAGRRRRLHRHEDMTVMPASALQQMPRDRAVVMQSHARPVIVRPEKVRHRADVRDAARSGLSDPVPLPAERLVPEQASATSFPGAAGGGEPGLGTARGWPSGATLPRPQPPREQGWWLRGDGDGQ